MNLTTFGMSSLLAKAGGALVLASSMVATAYAAPVVIEGRFNMTLGEVRAQLLNIDWSPPASLPFLPGVKTYGGFDVATPMSTRTGVFSDPVFGTINDPGVAPFASLIQDISGNPLLGPLGNFVPVNTPLMIANFMTLFERPTWEFTLTRLFGGTDIAGTPFVFSALGGGNTSISISFEGFACDIASLTAACDPFDTTYETTRFTGVVSTQFNQTPQQLLDALVGGGTLVNTWSGTVTVERVPEPASLALAGIALLGMFGVSRLRRRS